MAIPNIFSNVSVLPLPSSPANPIISPFLATNDTSFSNEYSAVRFSTSNKTSPGVLVFGGNWFVNSRPTINRIISSVVKSFASFVATYWPSRIIVTSSEMRKISAILCEI